jgi:hypothetical protein
VSGKMPNTAVCMARGVGRGIHHVITRRTRAKHIFLTDPTAIGLENVSPGCMEVVWISI